VSKKIPKLEPERASATRSATHGSNTSASAEDHDAASKPRSSPWLKVRSHARVRAGRQPPKAGPPMSREPVASRNAVAMRLALKEASDKGAALEEQVVASNNQALWATLVAVGSCALAGLVAAYAEGAFLRAGVLASGALGLLSSVLAEKRRRESRQLETSLRDVGQLREKYSGQIGRMDIDSARAGQPSYE
jgi:hypothetical protein